MNYLGMYSLPENVREYFTELVIHTVAYREKTQTTRNDLMQLMIDLRKDEESNLTAEAIAGNIFIFFIAGADTASNAITYIMYELARNEIVFEKLQKEVLTVLKRHGNKLDYDIIQEMKYLDWCIKGMSTPGG